MQKIHNNLLRLGLFSQIEEIKLIQETLQDTLAFMLIKVKPGRNNNIEVVIGYHPALEDKEGYFTGLVDLRLANLFGTGRKISLYWQQKAKNTSHLKIAYYEPWLLNYPIHLSLMGNQYLRDTLYVQEGFNIKTEFPLTYELSLTTGIEGERIRPSSENNLIRNSIKWSWLSGLKLDYRDMIYNPSKGFYAEAIASYAQRTYAETDTLVKSSFIERRLSCSFEYYQSLLFNNQILMLGFQLGSVFSDEIVLADYDNYHLGGTRSLRGYREDWFAGHFISYSTIEYRYLIGLRSRMFLFLDYGYYAYNTWIDEQNNISKKISDYPYGYGFGLRLASNLGVIGLDYAWGESKEIGKGKIHFQIMRDF